MELLSFFYFQLFGENIDGKFDNSTSRNSTKNLNDLRSGMPQAKADLIHSFADFKKAVTNVMEEDSRVTNYLGIF